MDYLDKGLDKASKIVEEKESSPNSNKENSVGSSVKQFYGRTNRFFPTPLVTRSPRNLPFNEVSATSLNVSRDEDKERKEHPSIFDSPPPSNRKSRENIASHKIGFPNAGKVH